MVNIAEQTTTTQDAQLTTQDALTTHPLTIHEPQPTTHPPKSVNPFSSLKRKRRDCAWFKFKGTRNFEQHACKNTVAMETSN